MMGTAAGTACSHMEVREWPVDKYKVTSMFSAMLAVHILVLQPDIKYYCWLVTSLAIIYVKGDRSTGCILQPIAPGVICDRV